MTSQKSPEQDASPSIAQLPNPRFRATPVSFTRRAGRLRPRHKRALARHGTQFLLEIPRDEAVTSVAPDFVLDQEKAFGRYAPLIVEVGSGQGEALLVAAGANPDVDFLGLEVYPPGLARTVLHAGDRNLMNLRVIEVNAAEALATMLKPGSVDEVWVFFPDPWHKSKHVKRRIVSPSFVELLDRVLRPGGTLRLATDWEPYARQIAEVLGSSSAFDPTGGAGGVVERFTGRAVTGFEKKALAAGRPVTDFAFRKRM